MAKATPREKSVVEFDEAVTLTGYGKFHMLIMLASGGALMCVIIETMCTMFIIPAAQCDLNLSLTEKGILSSISFFGVVSSSHLWGFVADTRGRRNVLIISLAVSSVIGILSSLVPWSWLFIVLRFFNGFFVGGASAVVYAYIGEFHDATYRPKVMSWVSTFVAFGNMYLPGLAWVILPQTFALQIPVLGIPFKSWRLLLIIYSLPSLIFATLLSVLPESPKYLMAQGKKVESLQILRTMYAVNSGKSKKAYPVLDIAWDELGDETGKKPGLLKFMWKQTVPLFQKSFIVKTLMICALQFGIFGCNAGLTMWYPQILNAMSDLIEERPDKVVSVCNAMLDEKYHEVNSTEEELLLIGCKDAVAPDVFAVTLSIAFLYMLNFIFIGVIINLVGNRRLLITMLALGALSGIGAQLLHGYTYVQVFFAIYLMSGSGIGIVNTIAVDLFPTQIRAMAFSISLMLGRCGAVTGANLLGPILYGLCDYTFFIIASVHAVLILIVILLPSPKKLPSLVA